MSMNEYGEIVRTDNQASNDNNTRDYSFESEIQKKFAARKKFQFNLITLLIAVPLYAIIGYFVTKYFLNAGYHIDMTCPNGALVGGMFAFTVTLTYNNTWATKYEGGEYCISLLISGVVAVIIALVVAIVYGIIQLVKMFFIFIVILFFAGLFGG